MTAGHLFASSPLRRYAAMLLGPRARVLSNDELRDHTLAEELGPPLFKRWKARQLVRCDGGHIFIRRVLWTTCGSARFLDSWTAAFHAFRYDFTRPRDGSLPSLTTHDPPPFSWEPQRSAGEGEGGVAWHLPPPRPSEGRGRRAGGASRDARLAAAVCRVRARDSTCDGPASDDEAVAEAGAEPDDQSPRWLCVSL